MNLLKIILIIVFVMGLTEPIAIHSQAIRLGGPTPMEKILTPAQQARLQALQLKMRTDMHTVSSDVTLSKEQKQQKEAVLSAQYDANLKALLTPAQQNKVHKFADLDRRAGLLYHQSLEIQHEIYITLTAAQKAKLQPISQEYADRQNAINADKTLTDSQRAHKRVECDISINNQRRSLMTPSQRAQFDKAAELIKESNDLRDKEK